MLCVSRRLFSGWLGKRACFRSVRDVGLHAGYTAPVNQRPFLSADPKVEPKNKKKENTMGGMVHVRGAQPTASIKTRKK